MTIEDGDRTIECGECDNIITLISDQWNVCDKCGMNLCADCSIEHDAHGCYMAGMGIDKSPVG